MEKVSKSHIEPVRMTEENGNGEVNYEDKVANFFRKNALVRFSKRLTSSRKWRSFIISQMQWIFMIFRCSIKRRSK